MDWFTLALKALGDKLDWSTLVLLVILLIHDRRLSGMTRELTELVRDVSVNLAAQKNVNDLATARMTEIRDAIMKVALAIMKQSQQRETEHRERRHVSERDIPRPDDGPIH